ncbi:pyruvate, water dikinase regulatory protein [uncultured Bartonella sp.]|uniref:pyruvate, water dikinase regulatory protein n=1 Tax=uncultured Bartonella sp. TaxID=104108 RepID=UPI002620C624|nr:pyruvate, water dikinase regulatory protein [uncultured Bartonella sp.]
MAKTKLNFHLYLISDATGETLLSAGRAVASQFVEAQVIEHVYPLIRNEGQLNDVIKQIHRNPGIVLYTIVDENMARQLQSACDKIGVPSVSVLDSVFQAFHSFLRLPANRRVSAQHELNDNYFKRIDALNYTMDHDDGQLPDGLPKADVILVGISRTSKTPTSIYLANRGIKTANVPLVPGVEPPKQLFLAKNPLIVGLIASAERVSQVRQSRNIGGGLSTESYTDRASITQELTYAKQICSRNNWPIIDVSRRSIEETATAILELYMREHQI